MTLLDSRQRYWSFMDAAAISSLKSRQQGSSYYDKIDHCIYEFLKSDPCPTFQRVLKECRGAWPPVVADRITKNNLWDVIRIPINSPKINEVKKVELHLRYYEWYFDYSTISFLGDLIFHQEKFALMLGTPTLAVEAFKHGIPYALVDRNSKLKQRFSDLSPNLLVRSVESLNAVNSSTFQEADFIVLDPPWNLFDVISWLTVANKFARVGSKIVMPLFQRLTRPSAELDRAIIMRFLERIGSCKIFPRSISYLTPIFEHEAIEASARCPYTGDWREADLLLVTKLKDVELGTIGYCYEDDQWVSYIVGSQVVEMRKRVFSKNPKFLLRPIRGATGFRFDSVSARDARRKHIDVWTSRNRVAEVGDGEKMQNVLEALTLIQGNALYGSLDKTLRHVLSSEDEVNRVRNFLSLDDAGPEK